MTAPETPSSASGGAIGGGFRPGGPPAPGPFAVALSEVPAHLRGGVVAIGNFDGIHRGHQAVLARATEIAHGLGVPALVLTFEPHPRTFFRPDQPMFRLTQPPVKARVLAALGFDGMVAAAFDRGFASHSAEDFVREVLVEALGARHVVIGYDFHFGRARAGTPAFLAEAGRAHGFAVTIAPALTDEGGGPISSTRIRDALSMGDVAGANALLGWHWQVESTVRHGDKRGRLLGYPTANLALPADCALALGIYAVRARVDGVVHDAVASFGRRPTFDDGAPLLEVHLFNFAGDLYGRSVAVSLVAYQRPERRFSHIDALVEQMDRDSIEARATLAGLAPLSELDAKLTF